MNRPATLIDFQAARAARGLSAVLPSMPAAAYQVGQPVTVLGRPIRYGWVVGIARCRITGAVSYTIQTPQGRIVCPIPHWLETDPGSGAVSHHLGTRSRRPSAAEAGYAHPANRRREGRAVGDVLTITYGSQRDERDEHS